MLYGLKKYHIICNNVIELLCHLFIINSKNDRILEVGISQSRNLTGRKCNVMITGPADHGLYVIFLSTAMISFLYRLIIAMTSSPLYRLDYTSALALSRTEVLRVACKPKQFALIVGSQRLLSDQRPFGHGQVWFLRQRY